MITVEGSTQRLVEDGSKFFKNIRIIHLSLSVLLLATGIAALVFSLGSDGDAQIPYFFSAFVAGAWHIVFVVLCQVCLHYLKSDRHRLKEAPTWVNAYTIACSIFVIFNVMGIVFVVVNGMCIRGQLCYYDKNETANRSLAISLVFLHFVSILLSVFLAKKSHLIDSQLGEDITIRVNHSFVWGKRKASKVTSSSNDSSNYSNFSSTGNENVTTGAEENTQDGGEIVEAPATSWLDKKRAVIIKTRRSKSHPNLRRHLEINQDIEGTVVSIYSDTEEKPDESKQRKGKRRQVLPKRNRVTPTKIARDSSNNPRDSPESELGNTTCEIQISNPPVTVKIVNQRSEQMHSTVSHIRETGLLSMSRESSALPSVDSRSNTEDSIKLYQESILEQQHMMLKAQEQLGLEQSESLKRQEALVSYQMQIPPLPGTSTAGQNITEAMSPPPPYPGHRTDDVPL